MKKVLKLIIAIVLAIVILSVGMFLIDCSRGKSGKTPIFAISTDVVKDGGTTLYKGLGYIISGFNKFTGGITAKIGPWEIELQEYKEIIVDDNNNFDEKDNEINIEDNMNIESGDMIIESNSGDIKSGDFETSGDIEESGNHESIGEIQEENNDNENIIESNEDEEEEFSFSATIIGINGNNVVVTPLEEEEINKSADMFSFSLNTDSEVYLIGQKVKIKYTGTIAETYPAQIDVISIERID